MPATSVAEHNVNLEHSRLWLREQIMNALTEVQKNGLSVSEATQIAVEIATDNLRSEYGDSQCMSIVRHVMDRVGKPIGGDQ